MVLPRDGRCEVGAFLCGGGRFGRDGKRRACLSRTMRCPVKPSPYGSTASRTTGDRTGRLVGRGPRAGGGAEKFHPGGRRGFCPGGRGREVSRKGTTAPILAERKDRGDYVRRRPRNGDPCSTRAAALIGGGTTRTSAASASVSAAGEQRPRRPRARSFAVLENRLRRRVGTPASGFSPGGEGSLVGRRFVSAIVSLLLSSRGRSRRSTDFVLALGTPTSVRRHIPSRPTCGGHAAPSRRLSARCRASISRVHAAGGYERRLGPA